jgi:hypothetical protein
MKTADRKKEGTKLVLSPESPNKSSDYYFWRIFATWQKIITEIYTSYILIALSVCHVTILALHSMAEPASVNGAAQG